VRVEFCPLWTAAFSVRPFTCSPATTRPTLRLIHSACSRQQRAFLRWLHLYRRTPTNLQRMEECKRPPPEERRYSENPMSQSGSIASFAFVWEVPGLVSKERQQRTGGPPPVLRDTPCFEAGMGTAGRMARAGSERGRHTIDVAIARHDLAGCLRNEAQCQRP
jgi:hypothetical protein